MASRWELVSGVDLHDAHVRHNHLSDFLPDTAAIYLWRRAPRVPREALATSAGFRQWLDNAMQIPIADVRDQRLSHYAVLDRLTLRSRGLTRTKHEQFTSLMDSRERREWLARYLHSLSQVTPPLYCGETANLVERTRSHLSGDTGFGQRLQDPASQLSLSDLELAFYRLDRIQIRNDMRATEFRTLLELITTAFSVAPHVSRRG